MFKFLKKIFGTAQDRTILKYYKIADKINALENEYQKLSELAIRAKTDEFRQRLSAGETCDEILPEAYAVVKNACRRLLGQQVHIFGYNQEWDMVPYDVQLIGAISMHKGCIAEMQTGEGKTLTATMPLYLHALTGKPVHIVTVNDYLAQRDCEWMGEIFRWLGLSVGALTNATPVQERKELYQRDIVYGTASEFGFDYLRDNSMANNKNDQVQRGYYFSIIDETDSILIDEARTPLIISGPVPVSRHRYDELKDGVKEIVNLQRNLSNKLATEAHKIIKRTTSENNKDDKEFQKELDEAFRKIWLVSKGTPHNKILKRILESPDNRSRINDWDIFYYSDQNKKARSEILAQLYILVEERSSEYELTDKGIQQWSTFTKADGDLFTMLDLSSLYIDIDEDPDLSEEEKVQKKLETQEEDSLRKERSHNLRQLLRSHLLMEKDVDYIVQEGDIVIIDENTGRPQPGRRFSEGLHQAIEAKEGVKIQRETQTYATITLQNYFRLYDLLAGMTGTAITEAHEFKEIYHMDVLQIPSHRKCMRKDACDEVYMSEREKYNAILAEVRKIHSKDCPILIGTESVDISEKLSRIFRQQNLPHTILNARQHQSEAEIISMAGQAGAITISTNMAGRGTDIKLGKGVAEKGGLYVLGTTRHNARRTDRQLRGRCGRQGDPGASKFYVSFEDQLMRLFASPKITGILKRLRPPEGEPISAKILDRAIESAQKRVEQRNYMIRKHTLQYDDVMNKHRQEIYGFRHKILNDENILAIALNLIEDSCAIKYEELSTKLAKQKSWDIQDYINWLTESFPVSVSTKSFPKEATMDNILDKTMEIISEALNQKIKFENYKVAQVCAHLGNEQPSKPMAEEAIRHIIITKLDEKWQEHLLVMDNLRSEVGLHSIAQKDPLIEFKHQAFQVFDDLSDNLSCDIAATIFRFQIVPHKEQREYSPKEVSFERERSLIEDMEEKKSIKKAAKSIPTTLEEPKIGRNDTCPCGSGKKYKKCCGIEEK